MAVNQVDAEITAVALSLYSYNISPIARSEALYKAFSGYCLEVNELVELLSGNRAPFLATELPYPTMAMYVRHALEAYGNEAAERVHANRQQIP